MSAENYYDPTFKLTSPAFRTETTIPTEYTDDGAGLSPPLTWDIVPADVKSFAVIVYDPDAPHGDFTHWLVYDLPGNLTGLSAGADIITLGGLLGVNSRGANAWTPPAPPPGNPPHRYIFQLHALDRSTISLPEGATRDQVEDAVSAYTLTIAAMIGYYGRPA